MGSEWADYGMTALLLRLRGIIQKVAAATGLSSYAVLNTYEPETVADFENEYYRSGGSDTTFTGLLSFSRASTATYFDENGDLQTATSGTPRVGHHVYNGTSWVNQGILLEPSVTNYMNDTEGLTTNTERNVTRTNVSAPFNGPGSAAKFAANTLNDFHWVRFGDGGSPAYKTSSFWLKSDGLQYAAVQPGNSTAVMFDLTNGTVTDVLGSPRAYGIQNYANGWYRCWVSATNNGCDVTLSDRSTFTGTLSFGRPVFVGNNTDGILIYGSQMEWNVDRPSSYIPTNSVTNITRAADSLSIAGTDLTYDSTNMSFAMDGVITYADEGTAAQHTFFEWVADANNYISMDLDTDSTDTGEVNGNQSATGTLTTVAATSSYSAGAYVPYSIAMRNTSSAINIAKDGTAETEDTSPTQLPDLSATSLVFAEDNAVMTVKTFRQWGDDITDAGIEAAS